MRIEKVSYMEWNKLAESAHKVAFGQERPAWMNTFDFAVVCFEDDRILSYATVIEMDKETAYMQHGGAMPSTKNSTRSYLTYVKTMSFLKDNYRRITTRIEGKNTAMLKFAFKQDLFINGADVYPGEIFLHLRWERAS